MKLQIIVPTDSYQTNVYLFGTSTPNMALIRRDTVDLFHQSILQFCYQ